MDVRSNIPDFGTPIIGADGRISEVWWRFLLQLFNRTGGATGVDGGMVETITHDNSASGESMVPMNAFDAIGRMFLDALAAAQVKVLQQSASSDVAPVSVMQVLAQDVPPVPVFRAAFDQHETVSRHGLQDDPDLHALATPTSAGFMSAADKAKLDSL